MRICKDDSVLLLCYKQVRDNSEYESMIQAVIATRNFYYSHSYDITLSLQKVEQLEERKTNFAHLPLHERVTIVTKHRVQNDNW